MLQTGPWTDADYVALTNAMVRYPPGVPERWQRIAERIGRSVEEATAKAKEMRENGGMPMSSNVQSEQKIERNGSYLVWCAGIPRQSWTRAGLEPTFL